MINSITTLPMILEGQRLSWLAAYQAKDTDSMGVIETKDFFVVHYQNVEKKADWHNNIANRDDNAPLMRLITTNEPIKVRHDQINENAYVITSYVKDDNQSILLKEMWEKQNKVWQISSLSITQIRLMS